MNAARLAADISHSTLRSRRSGGLPSIRIAAPAPRSATVPPAAKASSALVGIRGQSWSTAMNPATTASAPPR